MLVPNAALRPAVTALAPEEDAEAPKLSPTGPHEALSTSADETDSQHRDNSRKALYLWAVLLARINEAFPLTCPHCAGEMWIIAFVTDPISIQPILAHISEPTRPPALTAPACRAQAPVPGSGLQDRDGKALTGAGSPLPNAWGAHGGVFRGLIASTRWRDTVEEPVGIPILRAEIDDNQNGQDTGTPRSAASQ